MKSANGTKKFWEALRAHLKTIGAAAIEKITAIKANTITSFILGRSKGLTEESISELRRVGLIPAEIEAGDHQPLSNYIGEVKSVSAAAAEKGYSPATIRAWCKSGKLDYVKKGSRYLVAINEKFAAIPESEKAALRKRIVELEAENAQLRHQVETLQLEFSFEQPAAPDSDANLLAVDEAIVAQTQCQGCDKKAQCDCLVSDERPIYYENLLVSKQNRIYDLEQEITRLKQDHHDELSRWISQVRDYERQLLRY